MNGMGSRLIFPCVCLPVGEASEGGAGGPVGAALGGGEAGGGEEEGRRGPEESQSGVGDVCNRSSP